MSSPVLTRSSSAAPWHGHISLPVVAAAALVLAAVVPASRNADGQERQAAPNSEPEGWRIVETKDGTFRLDTRTGESFILRQDDTSVRWEQIAEPESRRSAPQQRKQGGSDRAGISVKRAFTSARAQGVHVTEVAAGAAAERAGLRSHDCIVAVNDEWLFSVADFERLVAAAKAGSPLRLTLRRWEGVACPSAVDRVIKVDMGD